jgi:hypothetical protein
LLPTVPAKKGSLFFSISWIRVVGLKKFAGEGVGKKFETPAAPRAICLQFGSAYLELSKINPTIKELNIKK